MPKKLIVFVPLAVVIILLMITLISIIASYNSMVDMREKIDADASQIEVRLQQRHDKMGQMINAIEGLEQHAEDIYQLITDARAAFSGASTRQDLINADALEADALSRLLVVVEDNPNITATSAYNSYINEVSTMENTLAVARRDYNASVQKYNSAVKKFPKVLYANMFGFEKQIAYWKMNNGADEIPMIEVNN